MPNGKIVKKDFLQVIGPLFFHYIGLTLDDVNREGRMI